MGYRTRYFPPLSIETNQLPANVITEDKIAPGAVTGQTILDGSVGSDDISANAITSIKIASGAVTADKIADGVVGLTKLSFTPVSRPLSPPITTAEIADGAVTSDKMAAAIIDTAQLVDSSVTTVKIAPDSIDATKLKTNSITSGAILAGAVGESELGTDSVITVKIKDANVTTPKIADGAITNTKLAPDHLALFIRDNPIFVDDFVGATLGASWAASGDVGGSASMESRSKVTLVTDVDNTDAFRINHNGVLSIGMEDNPKFFFQVRPLALTNVLIKIGLRTSATEFIYFQYDSSVDANWHAITRNGGATSDVDTSIPVTTGRIPFRFERNSDSEVEFYINNVLVATIITNIPTDADDAEPWIEIETQEAAFKTLQLDYVFIDYNRAA